MSISIHQLQFDPASPADNQRIGSFLISAGGTVITDSGGALSVNDAAAIALLTTIDADTGSISSTLSGLSKLEDAAHSSGDAGIMALAVRNDAGGALAGADGDYASLQVDSSGRLRTTAVATSNVADDAADAENPIKVGGRGVTTASALTALSATNDRFDLLGDLYRRLFVNDSHNVAHQITQADVTDTAAEVLATPLAGRKTVIIQNLGDKEVYVLSGALQTIADGIMIPKNASMEFKYGEAIDIFMIAPSGTQDVRFLEAA